MHIQHNCIQGVDDMPLLQVRDIPEDLYEKLSLVAKAENRSIAQETIVLLRSALNQKQERIAQRKEVLAQFLN
jgi:plasmid stability protein